MEDSGPITRTCSRCGVAVAPGYLKCPRCHAELPHAVRRRAPTAGGGTTVEAGGARTLYLIAGAAIVLIGVSVWLLVRSPDAPPEAGGADAQAAAEPDDETAAPDDEPGPDRAPPERAPPPGRAPPAEPPERATALPELSRALRGERLWATVTGDGDAVVINSSSCDEPGLTAIVDAQAGQLRAAGFATVRCKAPHGGVIFERGL